MARVSGDDDNDAGCLQHCEHIRRIASALTTQAEQVNHECANLHALIHQSRVFEMDSSTNAAVRDVMITTAEADLAIAQQQQQQLNWNFACLTNKYIIRKTEAQAKIKLIEMSVNMKQSIAHELEQSNAAATPDSIASRVDDEDGGTNSSGSDELRGRGGGVAAALTSYRRTLAQQQVQHLQPAEHAWRRLEPRHMTQRG